VLEGVKVLAYQEGYKLRDSFVSLCEDTYGYQTMPMDFRHASGPAVAALNSLGLYELTVHGLTPQPIACLFAAI
jgi:hypothetical protein